MTKEQIGRYSYEIGQAQAGEAPELASVRQILSRYREVGHRPRRLLVRHAVRCPRAAH